MECYFLDKEMVLPPDGKLKLDVNDARCFTYFSKTYSLSATIKYGNGSADIIEFTLME